MARKGIKIQQGLTDQGGESDRGGAPGIEAYQAMSYTELRRVASARGVVIWRRKRSEVEADLAAQDGA